MFALLTIDFNRVTIGELNVTAVAVTAMLAMHYLLSPFQVITGRFTDQHPIGGYRRTPYLLLAAALGSLVFLLLPTLAHQMGTGAPLAFISGFALLGLFGVAIAIMGASHHALIAEVTDPRARGGVMAVVQTFTIMSTIFAAVIMNQVRPEYTPEAMQRLYNLTPFMVIIPTLLGVIGLEKRLKGADLQAAMRQAREAAPPGNPISVALDVLRSNNQARGFFAFVFIAILSIFLQDNILEVFGKEVFDMSIQETTRFQPTWGGAVLIGMLLMGLLSVVFAISKRKIVLIGAVGTAAGMVALALSALWGQQAGVHPSLMLMGFFTGIFNVGALAMMMDMTVEGAIGLYMGLWGMAQAFGNGLASFAGGALHTAFIETGLLAPNAAYFIIFGIEAVGMLTAAYIMWHLSITRFQREHQSSLTRADALRALEVGAPA
jgi:BCD family chlorophyll transporter-like MFS transporter